jgi:hypothetical protein
MGTTVGQAKHTLATNAHFSDPDFSGESDSAVLRVESARVKNLVAAGQLDNYILFSNRRLGGVTEPKIRAWFGAAVGLAEDRVRFGGIEYLDDLITSHPEIVTLARIDPLEGPLLVGSPDLAEVILAIAEELAITSATADAPVVDRISWICNNSARGELRGALPLVWGE